MIIELGVFLFLCTLSYTIIKLIPFLGEFLKKEKTTQNNYSFPQLSNLNSRYPQQYSENNKYQEKIEEAEEKMDRIFSIPDLDSKIEKNFESLGNIKKKES